VRRRRPRPEWLAFARHPHDLVVDGPLGPRQQTHPGEAQAQAALHGAQGQAGDPGDLALREAAVVDEEQDVPLLVREVVEQPAQPPGLGPVRAGPRDGVVGRLERGDRDGGGLGPGPGGPGRGDGRLPGCGRCRSASRARPRAEGRSARRGARGPGTPPGTPPRPHRTGPAAPGRRSAPPARGARRPPRRPRRPRRPLAPSARPPPAAARSEEGLRSRSSSAPCDPARRRSVTRGGRV
jgi:hypothetical protein